jgi:hypothetical protein
VGEDEDDEQAGEKSNDNDKNEGIMTTEMKGAKFMV